MTDRFPGFPTETFQYLKDLEANNSKDWFNDNRASYDAYIMDPALTFIDALGREIKNIEPCYIAQARLNGSFRRLNRDVRFSKDKTPYTPRLHMIFWTADHPLKSPAVHLVLRADSFGFGAGEWGWTPERLKAFRAELSDEAALASLGEALAAAKTIGCEMDEPPLKRMPSRYDEEHPAGDLLRQKSLVVRTLNAPPILPELYTDAAVEACAELVKRLSPINLWLKNNLK